MREIAAEQEEVAAKITLSDATFDREMETKRKEKAREFVLHYYYFTRSMRGWEGGNTHE